MGQVVTGQGVDSSTAGHVGGGSVGGHIGHETSVQGVGGIHVIGGIVGRHEGHEMGGGAPANYWIL